MTMLSLLPQATGSVPAEWLPPSAALGRFVPPQDLLWTGPAVALERNRYGFRIGSFGLLIRADVGSEVIRSQAISSLPGSAPWLMGLLNLRGNLIPVFNLRLLLGTGESDQSRNMLILILDKGENAVGMVIDGFPQALLALHTIPHLPQLPTVLQEHVSVGYVKDEYIWLEFNHESFFEALTRVGANQ
jgi:twitching motility protein PilI